MQSTVDGGPSRKQSLRQGLKRWCFICQLNIWDSEGKGEIGWVEERWEVMLCTASQWWTSLHSKRRRCIRSAQQAWWLHRRDFLRRKLHNGERRRNVFAQVLILHLLLFGQVSSYEELAVHTSRSYPLSLNTPQESGSHTPRWGIPSKNRRGGMTWGGQGSAYWEWVSPSPRASTLTPANSGSFAKAPAKMAAEWSRRWMGLPWRRKLSREIEEGCVIVPHCIKGQCWWRQVLHQELAANANDFYSLRLWESRS